MIQSMTGFGVGSATEAGWHAEITIRTLNHRYLSVRVRAVSDRPRLQAQIEELVKRAFTRGEIGVWVTVAPVAAPEERAIFDHATARDVFADLVRLGGELALDGRPTLADLIRAGGLQTVQQEDEALWPAVERACRSAMDLAVASRASEGAVLNRELDRLIASLAASVKGIESELPRIADDLRSRLRERLEALCVEVDPQRFEAEVVLLVERYDVREELVRLRGHLERARSLLAASEPIGKELDFLSQEMLREANTLGSKLRDGRSSGAVIDMKVAIEQFREQVQNVE